MTAIRATFSDFKLIKTRKVAQLVMEVPIEACDAALAALGGVPRFDSEVWVGIARLTEEAVPAPRKEMTRAQWAGMLCQDAQFQTFVHYLSQGNVPAQTDDVAEFVRDYCDVKSRSEIGFSEETGDKWDMLKTEYDAWRGKIGRP